MDKIELCDLYYGLIQIDKELNGGKGAEIIWAAFEQTGFPTEKASSSKLHVELY